MLKDKRLKSISVQNLEVVGILISRPSGIVLCRYNMPVLKLEDLHTRRNAKLTLQSKVNSILPENDLQKEVAVDVMVFSEAHRLLSVQSKQTRKNFDNLISDNPNSTIWIAGDLNLPNVNWCDWSIL